MLRSEEFNHSITCHFQMKRRCVTTPNSTPIRDIPQLSAELNKFTLKYCTPCDIANPNRYITHSNKSSSRIFPSFLSPILTFLAASKTSASGLKKAAKLGAPSNSG